MSESRALVCDCGDEAPASVWWRIGGGAFLAMNAMVFSIAVNGSEVSPAERYSLELTILCAAVPVYLLLAPEFLAATWRALRQRRLAIEFLFLIGILASLASSAIFLLRREGNGYADVAAMLLVIYALGRQIGAYGKQKVLRSLESWAPRHRQVRRLMAAGSTEQVPADLIAPGDRLRVLPGETVPVDCRLLSSGVFLHEASLTGESLVTGKKPGDAILAGSFPLDASFDAEAIAPAGANEIDRVRQLMEAGLARPGVEQALAITVLRWFVPLVVAVSAASFWWHALTQPWDRAIFVALSVAVIACPCALGFATPLAVWTAIARLREYGIVARSGEAVEKLGEIDTVVFDKTGTLTLPGEYEVTWTPTPAWRDRQPELRHLLREAELASNHPLARVLAPLWEGQPAEETTTLEQVRLIPGQGIEATFANGTRLFAGQQIIQVNGETAARIEIREAHATGLSPALKKLEAQGVQLILATGDSQERAAAIPIVQQHARQTPAAKHALLQSLQGGGKKVLFAGDGLNDSAAMAWSHVSCAAPESVDLVREASGLLFLHRDWSKLAPALELARKTRQVVRTNIIFSLAYNLAGISAAATGWLHPVAAALLMTASSLTVIIYTMHLMDWEPQS